MKHQNIRFLKFCYPLAKKINQNKLSQQKGEKQRKLKHNGTSTSYKTSFFTCCWLVCSCVAVAVVVIIWLLFNQYISSHSKPSSKCCKYWAYIGSILGVYWVIGGTLSHQQHLESNYHSNCGFKNCAQEKGFLLF